MAAGLLWRPEVGQDPENPRFSFLVTAQNFIRHIDIGPRGPEGPEFEG